MRKRIVIALAVSVVALIGGLPGAALAQNATPEELRDFLIEYAAAVRSCGEATCTGADTIEQQLLDLDEEQLQALYDAIEDVECLMENAQLIIDYCVEEPECTDYDEDGYSPEGGDCGAWDCNDEDPEVYPGASELCNDQDDDCDEEVDEDCEEGMLRMQSSTASGTLYRMGFPPDYPSGSTYDLYQGDILAFNLLNNGRQERANTDAVAGFKIAYFALLQATNAAQSICDSTPSIDVFPGNLIACPPAGILAILRDMTWGFLDEVDFHEGNIDSAEIEAGYENSLKVLNNTAVIYDDLVAHDADMDDRLDDIDGTLDVIVETIGRLEEKVDRIEAKLDLMDEKMDTMLAWQLETIRLVMTPQGQRSTDVPACNGEPCNWPASNDKAKGVSSGNGDGNGSGQSGGSADTAKKKGKKKNGR